MTRARARSSSWTERAPKRLKTSAKARRYRTTMKPLPPIATPERPRKPGAGLGQILRQHDDDPPTTLSCPACEGIAVPSKPCGCGGGLGRVTATRAVEIREALHRKQSGARRR